MVCISIRKDNNSDQNFAKMNEYFLIKNGTKNEPSVKLPNPEGFLLTPNDGPIQRYEQPHMKTGFLVRFWSGAFSERNIRDLGSP